MDKKVFDELEKINKNNKNDKESLFPEYEFLASCLRMGLTISDLKILTYVDVLKIFISFLRRKRRSAKRCKKSNTRRYTKFSCKNVGGRKMAGTLKGIILEIGGDTSGLQKALSSINTATSSLTKELRGINSLLKLDPKNTELVSQKQQVLAENIEQTSQKLEELRKLQEMANRDIDNISPENYRNLQREIINTENKLKDLQVQASKWTQAGEKLEEFGTKVTNISSKIDKLGSTLTTSLTLPVLAIGTAAINTGNDFEAQMSRVQAIAGATKDELKQLTDQAIDLGASTSFSASEVAEGMENLASAGFTTNEIMEAMPGLLDLAASSGADLATASEIAASSIRGFGLEASTSAHVADVFAEASARTNAQVEDMGYAMKYIAPVANTMGLKIEEVAAAIGIMSDAGVKGEQAGTTLRGALTRLTKPTDKMIDVMDELGLSFYDNEGKMKSLTEMISMLQNATKGLTEEEQQYALTTLFGTESLSGMVALINRGSGELSDMTKSFENCDGAAQDMADTMLDNTKGAFESLSGSLESAGIAIQRVLAPQIKELAKWIQGLVDDFNDLSDEEKENIVNTGLLVAAIGPAIKIISKLGTTVGSGIKIVGNFSEAIALIGKTSTKSFSEASKGTQALASAFTFLTTPVGLVITAIAALAAGLIYLATRQTEAQKKAKEFAEEMANEKEEFAEYNKSIDKTTNSNIAQINSVERLKNELSKLVDENGKVKEGYEGRVSFILNQLNSALGTEYKLNGNIIQSYKDLQTEIDKTIEKKRAEAILNGEQEKWTNAVNEEEDAVKNLTTARENLLKVQDEYGVSLDELREKAAGSIGKEKDYLNNVINAYDDATQTLKDNHDIQEQYANDYALFMEGKYNEVGQSIKNATSDWTDSSLETIRTSIIEQSKALENYKAIYDSTGSEVAKSQMEQAKQNMDNLINELTSRTSTITSMSGGEIAAWRTLANESYEEYSAAIAKMEPDMQEKIQVMTGILAANTSLSDNAADMARRTGGSFNANLNFKRITEEEIEGATAIINVNKSFEEATGNIANEGTKKFNEYINSQKGEDAASDYLAGANQGANNKKSSFWDLIFGIGKKANQKMRDGLGDGSPSVLAKEAVIDYFLGADIGAKKQGPKTVKNIEEYAKQINKNFGKTLESTNLGINNKLGAISSKIINGTQTVYTTPTLNIYTQGELNIRKVADEVNKIFGSKY